MESQCYRGMRRCMSTMLKPKDYLLPVPTEEFSKIGETVLSFIQWPTKYIELTKVVLSGLAMKNEEQIKKMKKLSSKSTFCTSGTLATIINKCLFGKTSSNDRLRQSRVAILWGMFYKKNVDFPELIWEDFAYQIDIRQAKLRILEIMPYPRFNKIIINLFLSLNPSIPKGPSSGMHTIKDDGLISRLKFVRIGEDFQEYGRAIPETTLTKGIKQSEAYQTFIKYSIGLIPSKKSKGKGSQGKKLVVTPKPASVKVFDESDPEPTKRKTCSRRKSRKKVSISADDNIIPEPAIALELGKSMSLTKAEEEEAASRVHATHEHTLSVSKKKSPDQSQKLKGIQTLTAKEQLVADTMQALKAISFTTLSEGTGTKLGVPDEVKGSSKAKDIEWLTTEEEEEKNDDDEDDRSIDIEKTNDDKETDDEFVHGDEYVHDNVDEEMKDVEVADTRKDDEEITDAEKAKVEKTKELKGDNKKAKLPLTSSSLSVSSKFGNQFLTYSSDISLTGTLKDTANAEINSLLDIQILQEVPHISSLSILTVPVLVIPEPIVLSPIPEIPLVTPVTTLIPPPYVTNLTPVQQQQTTPIPTPPITIVAPVATTVPDPFPAIAQRVSVLEKDVKELKQVDHSPAILAIIRSQVPATVDAYLGSSLGDALQKVFQKHTKELMQQSSQTDVFRIIKIKKEQAAKEKMPKFSGTPYDEAAKAEFKQKQILFKMMRESKSYKKHLKHKALYDALMLLLIQDEDDLDRVIPYLRKRDRKEDEDPSAGSNQGKRKRSSGKDFEPSKTSLTSKETS
ncbi:hypothetical protein Tco_0557334 [Tanacetum coccineum]